MTLTATEFLQGFLQRVLPRGFVRIRQFGFLGNNCRTARLKLARQLLSAAYASEMLRAGVGLPTLMNLPGHVDPDMTMRYLDVTLTDLQWEFQLARSKPRHLAPQPRTPAGLARPRPQRRHRRALRSANVLEMFRRTLPDGTTRNCLDRLSNRLIKITAEVKRLALSCDS